MSAVLGCLDHEWYASRYDGHECLRCGATRPYTPRPPGWPPRPLRLTRRGEHALATAVLLGLLIALAVVGRVEGIAA